MGEKIWADGKWGNEKWEQTEKWTKSLGKLTRGERENLRNDLGAKGDETLRNLSTHSLAFYKQMELDSIYL